MVNGMGVECYRNALILTGPTGSGKSRLGVELALRLNAEIISMDSMAVYRGMDIGTAKPSLEERRGVPHHLIDALDPWQSASVAWWLEAAARCCHEIEARGKRALIVGGTPMYLKALLRGLFDGPPGDEVIRERLALEAQEHGNQRLHQRLATVDPVSASRLHPNDVRRVIRALEVWELTGTAISAWQQQWLAAEEPPSPERCLCLDVPRQSLYAAIDARVRHMIDAGLVAEVDGLRRLEPRVSREASQALGYKELFDHLEGKMSLAEAVVRIQTRSRQFAKRQLTWFRHLPECRLVSPELTFTLWGVRIQ